MKKISLYLFGFLFFLVTCFVFNGHGASAAESTKTKEIDFPASQKAEQSQTITLPNLLNIENVTVDTGDVTYEVKGKNVQLNVKNGKKQTVQTGGEYTPASSKYVAEQTSSYYTDSEGYSGSLSSYVYSGSYSPSSSKTVSSTAGGTFTCDWKSNSSTKVSWSADYGWSESLPSSIYYNSGGYSGTLYQTGSDHISCNTVYPSYTAPVGTHAHPTTSATGYYSGTVTMPGYDSRVFRYQGYVSTPSYDTRIYRYQGTVNRPATDTRTYQSSYIYKVAVRYRSWEPDRNPISTEGLALNGLSQYFRIPDQARYHASGDFTYSMLFKPKSVGDQALLSNGVVSLAMKDGQVEGTLNTGSGPVTVGIDTNNLFLDSWNSLILSLKGNELSFYYNGQIVDTKKISGVASWSSSKDLLVGAGYNGSSVSSYLNSEIRSVNLWNRALSAAEIQSATQGDVSDQGVGAWNFLNYTTSVSYDKSGLGNNSRGNGFGSMQDLYATDVDDLGIRVHWDHVPNASTYEVTRDGKEIYSGSDDSYFDDALVSDTTYSYAITPKGSYGEGVSSTNDFTTAVGTLEILQVPDELTLSPVTLNAEMQTSKGTFSGKLIVKDTRKKRDGWTLWVNGTTLTSLDTKRQYPFGTVKLTGLSGISQTRGLKQELPTIAKDKQTIDQEMQTIVTADSSKTGYGIYEIELPAEALECTLDPAYSYVNPDSSPLDYQTELNWTIEPGK